MTTQVDNTTVEPEDRPLLAGLLAEFPDVDSVVQAAKQVRAAGYTHWDVHSPFPIHGIDHAMGIRPTILPWLVLCGGLTGVVVGLLLQWYTNAFDYPFLISGKPFMSMPAFVPVIFELAVLLSALTAVFGMLGLNRLPMLYNPLFKSDRFRRVTADRFFISISARDPKFDQAATGRLLESLNATAVERVED
jgi:hypothetical protein